MPSRLTLGCLLACLMSGNLALGAVQPVDWLLEQVRIGEASGREDLVSNSLYSLSLVEPNHPELLAAQARQALRQGKTREAKALPVDWRRLNVSIEACSRGTGPPISRWRWNMPCCRCACPP